MQNPFSLLFGKAPEELISRPIQTNEIMESFRSSAINQQLYIITGVRGSGKTVMMTHVADILKQETDWIVVELNPARNLLHSLAAKLCSMNQCAEIFRNAKINLSFLGLGVEIGGIEPIKDEELAITKMLESLQRHGKKILVTIDEVTNNEYMQVFASAYQIFIRQNLPIYLLMTGLYENIDNLQNEKNLTFLYRAPKINLKPLNLTAIAEKYKTIFRLEPEKAQAMARMTKGYSFAFQVLGYLTWQQGGDFEKILSEYRQYLEEYVYDKIWSELSAKDKQVAYGIAKSESPKIKEIRQELHMETNEFNPYRKRLIRKGILNGDERGMVYFTLPCFEEYVMENM